jgi:hypothetical protein
MGSLPVPSPIAGNEHSYFVARFSVSTTRCNGHLYRFRGGVAVDTCLLSDDPLPHVQRGAVPDQLFFPDPYALGHQVAKFNFLLIFPCCATGAPAACRRVQRSLSARAILT